MLTPLSTHARFSHDLLSSYRIWNTFVSDLNHFDYPWCACIIHQHWHYNGTTNTWFNGSLDLTINGPVDLTIPVAKLYEDSDNQILPYHQKKSKHKLLTSLFWSTSLMVFLQVMPIVFWEMLDRQYSYTSVVISIMRHSFKNLSFFNLQAEDCNLVIARNRQPNGKAQTANPLYKLY